MKKYLVFGEPLKYYIWEEDFNKVAELITEGKGTLIEVDDKKDYSSIINKCLAEFKSFTQITKVEFKILKSRLKIYEEMLFTEKKRYCY